MHPLFGRLAGNLLINVAWRANMNTKYPSDRIIDSEERRQLVPYSDMHIWRLEKTGHFPQRVRLGKGRIGWSLNEIQQWIAARKAERAN